MKKRNDLFYLRAISVIFVFLFHANPQLFKFGYMGVDIFFIISGFLITKSIIKHIRNKELKKYFITRIKRILPSLLNVIFFTQLIFLIIFSYEKLFDLSKSSMSSLFFLSNIYYLFKSSYFDLVSEFRPLLHTWSLSVEMQFYIFFPILLILYFRSKTFFKIIFVLIFIFSLMFFLFFYFKNYENFYHYFTLFRLWEFMIGSAISITNFKLKIYKHSNLIILILITVFVVFGILLSVEDLIVTFTIVLLTILYLSNDKDISYISKPFNVLHFYGKISYSFYLIHYPAIIFVNFFISSQTLIMYFGIFIIVTFVSYLNYQFFEKNYKLIKLNFKFLIIFLIILFLSFSIFYFKGFQEAQIFQFSNKINNANFDLNVQKENTWEYYNDYSVKNLKLNNQKKFKQILLIGDSHSKTLFNSLNMHFYENKSFKLVGKQINNKCLRFLSLKGSYLNDCNNQISEIINLIKDNNFRSIIISFRWTKNSIKNLLTLTNILSLNNKINNNNIIVSSLLHEVSQLPLSFIDLYFLNQQRRYLNFVEIKNTIDLNNKIKKIVSQNSYNYLEINEYIMQEKFSIKLNEHLIYYDTNHLTLYGANLMGKAIKENLIQILSKN